MNKAILFVGLYVCLWISLFFVLYSDVYLPLYAFFFISALFLNFYLSKDSRLGTLLSLSSFIYFYQVPFVQYFPRDGLGVYDYTLTNDNMVTMFFVYNVVLMCLLNLIRIVCKINFDEIKYCLLESKKTKVFYFLCLIISFGMVFFALKNAGGIVNYLHLNKFEGSASQQLSFFTYKDFAVYVVLLGFLLGERDNKILLITIFCTVFFSTFELLSAKRFMVLVCAVGIFLFVIKKFKWRYVILFFIAMFAMTFFKFTYYNMRLFVLGQADFLSIFWFKWSDVLLDSVMISESRAHIVLLANYLSKDIFIPVEMFGHLLIKSLPLTSYFVSEFQTAGEYLRLSLHESWSGLGSSQYATPYLTCGIAGVLFIYSIIYFIYFAFYFLLKMKTVFVNLLFLSNIPVILFYFHREEIVVIFKSITVSSVVTFLVLLVASFVYSFTRRITNRFPSS